MKTIICLLMSAVLSMGAFQYLQAGGGPFGGPHGCFDACLSNWNKALARCPTGDEACRGEAWAAYTACEQACIAITLDPETDCPGSIFHCPIP